jgi:hypothetical protein
MFGFLKSKNAEVLQHWIAFAEGLTLAPSEFYGSVETEIKNLQVPGLAMARVEFSEGGALSDKRLYLRMVRERLIFDVCAAPFGKTFFFSCRFAEIPLAVQIWEILVVLALVPFCVGFSFYLCTKVFGILGPFLWPFLVTAFIGLAVYLIRNAVALGLKDLDSTLIKTPIVGSIYQAWFRRETYYRHDTRLMYLELVSRTVKQLAEEAVAAHGLKLLKQYEQAPILGELYKPVATVTQTVTASRSDHELNPRAAI